MQAVAQARSDLGGARRRLHALRPAHEQLILEQIAQSRERVADRRRRDVQPRGGARDAALFDQRVKNPEQIEVKQPELHFAHGTPEHSSIDRPPIRAIWSRGSRTPARRSVMGPEHPDQE
jgi:hypothetical protein